MVTQQMQVTHPTQTKTVNKTKIMKLFKPSIIKILLFILIIFSCNSQNKKPIIIDNFINEVLLNKNYDISQISDYIRIPNDSLKSSSRAYNLIKINILLINSQIDKKNYKVLNNDEMNSLDDIEFKKIDYAETEKVYYIYSQDKVITHLIVENNKIISFFNDNGKTVLSKSKNYGKNYNLLKPYIFSN